MAVIPRETVPVIIERYDRVALVGGPNSGKTTATQSVRGRPVIHATKFHGMGWKNQPGLIRAEVKNQSRFVVEGVQVARALRKGLKVDAAIWMNPIPGRQSRKQETMTKGIKKIFLEWWASKPGARIFIAR